MLSLVKIAIIGNKMDIFPFGSVSIRGKSYVSDLSHDNGSGGTAFSRSPFFKFFFG